MDRWIRRARWPSPSPAALQRRDPEQLVLAEATVKTHVGRILSKLELRDRVQIVVFAYEHGLASGTS
jgi:hypothetical protein